MASEALRGYIYGIAGPEGTLRENFAKTIHTQYGLEWISSMAGPYDGFLQSGSPAIMNVDLSNASGDTFNSRLVLPKGSDTYLDEQDVEAGGEVPDVATQNIGMNKYRTDSKSYSEVTALNLGFGRTLSADSKGEARKLSYSAIQANILLRAQATIDTLCGFTTSMQADKKTLNTAKKSNLLATFAKGDGTFGYDEVAALDTILMKGISYDGVPHFIQPTSVGGKRCYILPLPGEVYDKIIKDSKDVNIHAGLRGTENPIFKRPNFLVGMTYVVKVPNGYSVIKEDVAKGQAWHSSQVAWVGNVGIRECKLDGNDLVPQGTSAYKKLVTAGVNKTKVYRCPIIGSAAITRPTRYNAHVGGEGIQQKNFGTNYKCVADSFWGVEATWYKDLTDYSVKIRKYDGVTYGLAHHHSQPTRLHIGVTSMATTLYSNTAQIKHRYDLVVPLKYDIVAANFSSEDTYIVQYLDHDVDVLSAHMTVTAGGGDDSTMSIKIGTNTKEIGSAKDVATVGVELGATLSGERGQSIELVSTASIDDAFVATVVLLVSFIDGGAAIPKRTTPL